MAYQQDNNKEIDLTRISAHMRRYFSKVNDSIFDGILFIQRFIIIIIILVIAGAVLGYFKDKESHAYSHKIFVTPNFNSVDYLYEEVERINSKIIEHDTAYLAQIGIQPGQVSSLKVEPVVDLYNYLNQNENLFENQSDKKFEVFRLMAEKGDLKKIVEDPTTSKNFRHHIITFASGKEITAKTASEPLLKHLNSNVYYNDVQKEYQKNLEVKIAVNDTTLKQIDAVITSFTSGKTNGNLLYYNNNTELNEIIRAKTVLLKEQDDNSVNRVNFTKVIKDNATLLNIKKVSATTGRMKFIIPLLFLLLFVIAVKFISFYKYQSAKRKAAQAV
jgi:hypothetical protein